MLSMRRSLVVILLGLVAAVTSLGVTSCSAGLNQPTARISPVATSVAVGAELALDGSGSSDPNGLALQYRWRVAQAPTGSSAAVQNAQDTTAWFVPDVTGDYTIELQVSDGTLTSAAAKATFTAGPCGGNSPVVGAIASAPSVPVTGDVVVLGANATDADMSPSCSVGDALTWHWSLDAQPVDSSAALDHSDEPNPSFVPDQPGNYAVSVTVTDRAGHAATARATIAVGGCGVEDATVASASATPNPPDTGATVTLSAVVTPVPTPAPPDAVAPPEAGTDAGGDAAPDAADPPSDAGTEAAPPPGCSAPPPFTYHWTLVAVPPGSGATLADSPEVSPSFVADVPGTYTAEVYVTNAGGRASNVKSVSVVAGACGSHAPTVSNVRATPASPATGTPVQLSATVADADTSSPCNLTEHLSLTWTLAAVPAGSAAALSGADQSSPWFEPDVAGNYTVTVFATDGAGHTSDVHTLVVSATKNTCGTAAPVIGSITASPASTTVGSGVSLSASVSDADTGGTCHLAESFSYAWAFASAPSGSVAELVNATSAVAAFTPDTVGTYTVSLVVTDSEGHRSVAATKSVSVTAASTCGSASPVARLASATAGPCSGACTAMTISPTPPALPGGTNPYVVTMNGHASLRLDATASTDPDNAPPCNANQALSYTWTILSAPLGSHAAWDIGTGGTTSVAAPTLALDVTGVYIVQLVVSDGANSSAPLAVQITY
jgi:PKD repeat protein